MLERLLKKNANDSISKDQSATGRRQMKRPRDETSPTETKSAIDSTPAKVHISHARTNGVEKLNQIKPEPVTPSTKTNDLDVNDLNGDDMDFSMLDDEENQFDEPMDTSASTESNVKAEQIKSDLIKKENECYAQLFSNWESNSFANENDDDDALLGSIDVDATQISNSVDGKSSMKFWYWDAYEDPFKLPGKIFLFGKIVSDQNPKEFKSVCVTVENVNRSIYLLPRKYVSFDKIYTNYC